MKFPCRCLKCGGRKTLEKRPAEYTKQPICNSCHHRGWYLDKSRFNKNPTDRGPPCSCAGRILPHRKAQKDCIYHRDNVEALKLIAENNIEHKPVDHLDFYGDFEV